MKQTNDIGPLAHLVGFWSGDRGLDISPEEDGSTEENPYFETITFENIGEVTNADEQELSAVRYLQIVKRKSNNQVFHDQAGYFMWDKKEGIIIQSLTIPRGVCVLAGGSYKKSGEQHIFEVKAEWGDKNWGIIEQPFMTKKASTRSFRHKLIVEANTLKYSETTVLNIYGKTFEHTDKNELNCH